jgi:hypothetical protein
MQGSIMRQSFPCVISMCLFSTFLLGAEGPVFHSEIVKIPATPQPAYLQPIMDPVFHSTITRITGDPGTEIAGLSAVWDGIARHTYSKYAAWNCDQSLIFLGVHHGFPSMLFLDGTTYKPAFGRNTAPGSEMRWHATKPDLMVYVNEDTLGYWDVRKETKDIICEFTGYTACNFGPWEGNFSQDGTRIAIHAMKNNQRVAFVYDLNEKKQYPDIPLFDEHIDWVSISASGTYVVVNGTLFDDVANKKGSGPDRTRMYNLSGKQLALWTDNGRPSHYDLTIDAKGDDVAVGVSNSTSDEGRVIKRRLSDGAVTILTPSGYAGHSSTRNIQRPGWVYSTYQHQEAAWKPYWQEVIAIKLDGSMTVERIAHLHAARGDYLTQAQAVPSPDGKRVLWASAWDQAAGRPIGTYVAERAHE